MSYSTETNKSPVAEKTGEGFESRSAAEQTEIEQVESESAEIKSLVSNTLVCKNHSNTETLLRCNRCNEPICTKCAVQTAVGYRCQECIRGVQDKYFNAERWDNPIAFVVGFLVTIISAPIVGTLIGGFGFFGFMLAFVLGSGAGASLAQIIRRAVGRRRGRYLRHYALGGIAVGFVVALLFVSGAVLRLPALLFTGLAVTTAYQMLR